MKFNLKKLIISILIPVGRGDIYSELGDVAVLIARCFVPMKGNA